MTAGIIGHRATLATLRHEAATPSHAYLFAGPSNVGKATVALSFAADLACRTDRCRVRVKRHSHPDVTFIAPEGRTALGVDQARQAMVEASLRPVESEMKVFVFDDASLMTESAANSLLKTLEEPPARTVFILVADSTDDLPATVASRCRIIRFGRVAEGDIAAALVERGLDADRAAMTARIAGGSPGLALDLSANDEVVGFREKWLAVPGRVSSRPGVGFRLADEMLEAHGPLLEGVGRRMNDEIEELESRGTPAPRTLKERRDRTLRRAGNALIASGLEMLASWYLDAVSAQHGGPVRNSDLPTTDLARIAPRRAVRSAELVMDAVVQLRRNQRPRLVLAWLFTRLATDL